MITVTERAVEELRKMLAEEGEAGKGLRLGVDRGGCAGLQYAMRFTGKAEGDLVHEEEGVQIFLDPESLDYLRGCQIDFVDALNDSGFKIDNPNAARNCGCGTSFEPADGSAEPVPEGEECK